MKIWKIILFTIVSAALLTYSGMRAYHLSMTHDESATYLGFHDVNIFSCFSSPSCWGSANNHLLNTFLMQKSIYIFGANEFGIRFPNVAAHVLYLVFSFLLIYKIAPDVITFIGGFLMLNLIIYMLDFFSLARGYGLCAGFQMMSIYFLYQYIRNENWKDLVFVFIAVLFSISSNFTAFNYLAAVWGSLIIFHLSSLIPHIRLSKSSFRPNWKHHLIPLLIFILSIVSFGRILLLLKSSGEFEYGASSILFAYREMVRDIIYGWWANDNTRVTIALNVFAVVVIICIINAFICYWKKPGLVFNKINLIVNLIFIFMNFIMIVQHWLLDSNYLINRKALLFYPLIGLMFYLLTVSFYERLSTITKVLSGCISLILAVQFFSLANFKSCREWWYDVNTKEMVLYVQSQHRENEPSVKLAVNWLFHPSSTFYINQYNMNIDLMPYNKQIDTVNFYDYYYIQDEDFTLLANHYKKEKEYLWGTYLLKKY